jgi:signal transduction histidine kinase
MSLTLVIWNMDIFSLGYSQSADQALFWSRLFRVGMVLMPPAILHLAIVFSNSRVKWVRTALALSYVIAIGLIIANSFDLLVSHVERFSWGYYPRPRSLYSVHTTLFVADAILAFGVFGHAYRHSPSARVRMQARFWLLGLAIAAVPGSTNLLAVYGVPIYPMGSLGTAAYAGVVAYAIVQHRLMDVDIVITKGVTYALVSLSTIFPVFVFVMWLEKEVFNYIDANFSLLLLLSYLLVAVLFPLVRSRAEARIGLSLFREKHESRAVLTGFTNSIVRILDREKLLHELGDTLRRALHLDRIAVFVQDHDQIYRLGYSMGVAPTADEFLESDVLVHSLERRGEAALREELEASSSLADRTVIGGMCHANGWEVLIPLVISGKLNGFINLGRKRDLDVFSAGDLELLNTLAAEAAVALENARLNEELRRSQDIIRRADRLSALGTLAAGIAHEVRNPLVSIQTFFQLAPERLHDEEFFTTFLGMTAGEVKRISDLVTELLSFARSPSRSLGPVNLNELAERVATLLEPEARKHQLTLNRTLSPNPQLVHADSDQIKQVLINLVLNAIQATGPGGEVSVTSRSVEHPTGAFGQLEVRDTGAGIRRDHLDDIFNPFFTTKDKGTGLGLAIAHQIIAEHGGSIAVDSEEGRGTTFLVNLPVYVEDAVPSHTEEGSINLDPCSPRYATARKVAS